MAVGEWLLGLTRIISFALQFLDGRERLFSKKRLEPDVKILVVKCCFLQRLSDAY